MSGDLSRNATARALNMFLFQGLALGMYWVIGLPSNAILAGYGMDVLGMSKENAGFISTVMYSAGFMQFVSFALTNRLRHKKAFVLGMGFAETVFMAAILLIPCVVIGGRLNVLAQMLFFVLLFMSSVCLHLLQPVLSGWLSAVIPAARRGRYLGLRMVLLAGGQTVVAWAGLRLVGRWEGIGGFAMVVLGCCVIGACGYLALWRAPMPRVAAEGHFGLADFRDIRGHPRFARYLVFTLMLNAGFALACPYYGAFFLREVGLTFAQISWYVLGYNVIKLAGMWPAGRLVDRVGARPVLQAMVVIYMVFFFAFPWFNRDHLWLIVTVWSLVGVADSLCLVAGTSCLYHALPGGRERAGYLAVAQGAVMVMMGAGPLLVRPYLGWADGLEFWVAGVRLEKFRLLFVVSGLLTTLSLIPVRRLADTHDVRWGTVVGAVRRWRPFGLVPRFWRVPRG